MTVKTGGKGVLAGADNGILLNVVAIEFCIYMTVLQLVTINEICK